MRAATTPIRHGATRFVEPQTLLLSPSIPQPGKITTMPTTIDTTHDTPLFDPEDHRKAAAEQMKVEPTAIHCIGCGPDGFNELQPEIYSEALWADDGKLLKPAELIQPRKINYHRHTTWELRPTVTREPEPEREIIPPLVHAVPKLSRGARWHGIIGEVEGNYISTGDELVPLDSAHGLTVLSALHSEHSPTTANVSA
jgi:hypothetical protein